MFKPSKSGTLGFESMMGDHDQPLTLSDFDDYVMRLWRNSPTPADAMRFGMLQLRLTIREEDRPKVILRRFMIDKSETAVESLHKHTKIPIQILQHMKAQAAKIASNPDAMASFLADLAPIYQTNAAAPLEKGSFCVMKPTFAGGPPPCAHCGCGDSESRKLKTCARCRSVRYCCLDHQKADWPIHQKVCKEWPKGQK
jgi:hypothetical protein